MVAPHGTTQAWLWPLMHVQLPHRCSQADASPLLLAPWVSRFAILPSPTPRSLHGHSTARLPPALTLSGAMPRRRPIATCFTLNSLAFHCRRAAPRPAGCLSSRSAAGCLFGCSRPGRDARAFTLRSSCSHAFSCPGPGRGASVCAVCGSCSTAPSRAAAACGAPGRAICSSCSSAPSSTAPACSATSRGVPSSWRTDAAGSSSAAPLTVASFSAAVRSAAGARPAAAGRTCFEG